MFTLPDFREKQILFIQPEKEKEYCLRIKNQNIAYEENGKVVNQIPCGKVISLFVLGEISFTSVLLRKCLENGVSIHFLKRNLETYATVGSEASGNYLLRENQYALSDEERMEKARLIVKNKINNQLSLLTSCGMKTISSENLPLLEYRNVLFQKIDNADENRSLLGIEGDMRKKFFQEYFSDIDWRGRVPRGKIDSNNILLDIGYTILFNYIDSLLRLFGFDTYRGFYHRLFFQRKSLSCDIEEPFRCIVEKKLLKMRHLGQINEKDFSYSSKTKQYFLKYEQSTKYAKLFTEAILEEKEEIFQYVKAFYYHTLNNEGDFPFFDRDH